MRPVGSTPLVNFAALMSGMSAAARIVPSVTIPCSLTVTLVKVEGFAICAWSGMKMFPEASTSKPEVAVTITAPAVVEVATGRSAPVRELEPVTRPCSSKVISGAVPAVTVLLMLISPAASTVRPESVGTETAPMSVIVASGRSAATRGVVAVT